MRSQSTQILLTSSPVTSNYWERRSKTHTHTRKERSGNFFSVALRRERDRHYLPSYQSLFPHACRLSVARRTAEKYKKRGAAHSEILLLLQGNRTEILRRMKDSVCVCVCLLHLISILCMCVFVIRACTSHVSYMYVYTEVTYIQGRNITQPTSQKRQSLDSFWSATASVLVNLKALWLVDEKVEGVGSLKWQKNIFLTFLL